MFKILGNFKNLKEEVRNGENLFDFLMSKTSVIKQCFQNQDNIGFVLENVLDEYDEELLLFYGNLTIDNFEYTMNFKTCEDDDYNDYDIIRYEKLFIKLEDNEINVSITFQEDAYPDFLCREISKCFHEIFLSLNV